MPYRVEKRGDKWHVINTETGEDKGASDSKEKAEAHKRAILAATHGAKMRNRLKGGAVFLNDQHQMETTPYGYADGKKVDFAPNKELLRLLTGTEEKPSEPPPVVVKRKHGGPVKIKRRRVGGIVAKLKGRKQRVKKSERY